MNDTDKALLIAALMDWRRTIPEVGPAIAGALSRNDVRLISDLSDEQLTILHDACSAMAELTTEGFFQ